MKNRCGGKILLFMLAWQSFEHFSCEKDSSLCENKVSEYEDIESRDSKGYLKECSFSIPQKEIQQLLWKMVLRKSSLNGEGCMRMKKGL